MPSSKSCVGATPQLVLAIFYAWLRPSDNDPNLGVKIKYNRNFDCSSSPPFLRLPQREGANVMVVESHKRWFKLELGKKAEWIRH